MGMQVLVADDDLKVSTFIANGLKQEGHLPTIVHDGQQAWDQLLGRTFDVAVVDIMMPLMDGLTLIRKLREERVLTPVLILSAKRDVSDIVTGLRVGGDDYLVKPFSFSELLARVESLTRRVHNTPEPMVHRVGDLVLNVLSRDVSRNGKHIDLQPKEYALLEYLMRNAGRIVTKTMIMEHVWGYDFDPQTNVVEARISVLRTKVDRDFETPLIHTMRGVGYVLQKKN
ncbi:MAG: response regulator transcription factor [Candidatus Hydrogenedentes bacterium]|nr:response regulator transcription factor [Candidatus Hydrogenedentota bacterium]